MGHHHQCYPILVQQEEMVARTCKFEKFQNIDVLMSHNQMMYRRGNFNEAMSTVGRNTGVTKNGGGS